MHVTQCAPSFSRASENVTGQSRNGPSLIYKIYVQMTSQMDAGFSN